MRTRSLIVAAMAVLALAACHRKPPAKPPAPAAPLAFAKTTPDAEVKLALAPGVAEDPALNRRLYEDGVKELNGFVEEAAKDRAQLVGKGLPDTPYERTIDWSVAAASPRLISMKQSWFDFTGGAHPNHGSKSLLWDRKAASAIPRSSLFASDVDGRRLDAVLCDAIRTAKVRRVGEEIARSEEGTWPCPKWGDADFVLAPSTAPGKFGGLTFLFDPYAIGPYVEGDYAVTVPLVQFQDALAPAFKDQFAGAPAAPSPSSAAPAAPAASG